jgi:hypothetical protein
MDAYEALVKAYNEEARCSSPDGEMDYLLADIADFVESDASRPNGTVTEFQFLAATLARAARYVASQAQS